MQLCVAAARTSTDRLPHTQLPSLQQQVGRGACRWQRAGQCVLIGVGSKGEGSGFGREQAGVQQTCSAPRVSRVHAAELSRARGGGGRSAGHRAEQWC